MFAIAYALFAYGVGSVALFWFFFAAIGIAPYSLSVFKVDNLFAALVVNTFLVFLFARQHTIMARKSFKQKWTQIIPEHLERSTFVLVAGILMAVMLWFWQTFPGVIWAIENECARLAILGLAIFGVAYVLVTTLVTNHCELLGLRQAWLYATENPIPRWILKDSGFTDTVDIQWCWGCWSSSGQPQACQSPG